MKKLLIILLLFPLLLLGQQKKYRITTSKGLVIYAKQMRTTENRIDVVDEKGNIFNFKPSEVLSIREEIPNWEYFDWGKEKFTDFTVVKVDSLNQKQIFDLTYNWIKETYKNPEKVIKTTIDNSKIRIEGFQSAAIRFQILGMPSYEGATYSIEISFKDGRYKFDPISLKYYAKGSAYISGGDVSITVDNTSVYYNKKGNIQKPFRYFPNSVETLFNDLNLSLYNYLISKKEMTSTNDDW